MKKAFVPVILIAALLFTSLPALAWQYSGPAPGGRGGFRPAPPPRYYSHSHYRGPGIGGVIGGLLVGGLIAGAVVAATTPPVQVVQQPVYVAQPVVVAQPAPRMCSEERRVTGEYQYDARGNAVWFQFPSPMVRTYQVPCP